jgi:hypothetical protein
MQNFKIVIALNAYEIAHLMEAIKLIPNGEDWKTSIIIKIQDAITNQVDTKDIV